MPFTQRDPDAVFVVETFQTTPQRAEDLLSALRDAIHECLEPCAGFFGARIGLSPKADEVTLISRWADEEALADARQRAKESAAPTAITGLGDGARIYRSAYEVAPRPEPAMSL